MTSIARFIRHFLMLLAARIYVTALNGGSYFAPILLCLATVSFLFQRTKSLQIKLRRFLKRRFQHCGSSISKEKCKSNFNSLTSVFMDGISYRYRKWANPMAYVCSETSRSGGKTTDESENNSDEGSSDDESEDNFEKGTKMDDFKTDDSVICVSSTKACFEALSSSQIIQKRKAESEKYENFKRSKLTDSLKVGEVLVQTEGKVTDDNNKTSSDTSSCYNNEETLSVSDLRLTHVLGEFSKCDRIDIDEQSSVTDEGISIQKSKKLFPSQVTSLSRDKEPSVQDLHRNNSKDNSVRSSKSFSSSDSAMENTAPVCQTMHKATKSNQTETPKKSYPNPKKRWKNLIQDKTCNTQSDPRLGEKSASTSESHLEPLKRLQEDPSFRIMQDNNVNRQEMTSNINIETTKAAKYPMSPTDSFKSVVECPQYHEPRSSDANEICSEIVGQFLKKSGNDNQNFFETSNVFLEVSTFSSDTEEKMYSSDVKSTCAEGPEVPSDIQPCSSSSEPGTSKDERPEDAFKLKSYPGLSLQPLKVKKDARYQKKFYKDRKEIVLPKKIGEVIQWAAKKPRNEVTIPDSNVLPSDEKALPIDEYHQQMHAVSHNIMTIYDRKKEQKARNKLEKKSRKEQKERMRREGTTYNESSFQEESTSTESSSDSLPISEDSPVKISNPSFSRPKAPIDYDISMIEISPLKPVANVSPRIFPESLSSPASTSSQQESLYQPPLSALNIMCLSNDEMECEEPSSDSIPFCDFSALSVVIKFIDNGEIVNPRKTVFCRDMFCDDASTNQDGPELKLLKPFFGIEMVAAVSCTPVSVEEFLFESLKFQEIYYRTYYDEKTELLEVYRNSMTICVIPLSPDRDNELEKLTFSSVKSDRCTEPEHNYARNFDSYVLDVDMSEIETFETLSASCNEAKCDQNLGEQVTLQAGNMHQSQEILARDSSTRTLHDVNWTLHEIDLGENKAPWECFGENFCHITPPQTADIRIESEIEEWTADEYQSDPTSAANVEIKRPGQISTDSSIGTLPVLFGYPSLELLSKMNLPNIPKSRQSTVSLSGSEQCKSPNRAKTKSESSIQRRSNLPSVERMNSVQETRTNFDVSNLCLEKPASYTREKLACIQSETENPSLRTEINLNKCTTVGKNTKPSESNPMTNASGQQEAPGGHRITDKEESVSKESSLSSSKTEKHTKSIQ